MKGTVFDSTTRPSLPRTATSAVPPPDQVAARRAASSSVPTSQKAPCPAGLAAGSVHAEVRSRSSARGLKAIAVSAAITPAADGEAGTTRRRRGAA